jgi:hypothetical protein
MQNEDDKRLFSLLNMAYIGRVPMRLLGNNSCASVAGFETLTQAWVQ